MAHVKFETHRILFDGCFPQLRGFRFRAGGFHFLYDASISLSNLLMGQCCVIVQNLRKGHFYKGL